MNYAPIEQFKPDDMLSMARYVALIKTCRDDSDTSSTTALDRSSEENPAQRWCSAAASLHVERSLLDGGDEFRPPVTADGEGAAVTVLGVTHPHDVIGDANLNAVAAAATTA